jgi:hypothetical protein
MPLPCGLLGTLTCWLLLAPVPVQTPAEREIARLVQQLGDSQFIKREAAFQELKQRGPVALPALRKALKSNDAEIRRRAEELVPILEKRADSERVLTPSKIKFGCKEKPLGDVLKDLNKQTNYRFQIAEKDKALAERKITLATEELPFWDALDRLCQQARVQYELNANDVTLDQTKDNAYSKARLRQTYPARSLNKENVFFFMEGQHHDAATSTCGAVRCVLRQSLEEKEKLAKKTETLGASKEAAKRGGGIAPTVPVKPTAPAKPPVQGAPGLGGKGGLSRAESGRKQQSGNDLEKDDPRLVRTLTLEVCTEPKLQWKGPLQVRIDPLVDEKKQDIDFLGVCPTNKKIDPNNEPVQVVGMGPNGRQVIIQQEIALQCRLPENPGKVLTCLKGCLVGQVQTPTEAIVEVPDVTKAGKDACKGKDSHELVVVEYSILRKRNFKVTVDLNTPGAPNGWVPGAQVQMNQFQVRGNRGGNFGNANLSPDITVTDAKGRTMTVTGRNDTQQPGKGVWTRRITLFLEGEDDEATPRKLVYSMARTVTVEVPFEFKNVPLQ